MISVHFGYYVLYTSSWARKYKSNDVDFPWESNKEKWYKDFPEILRTYVRKIINSFLIIWFLVQ
jgi:hypothetical protein